MITWKSGWPFFESMRREIGRISKNKKENGLSDRDSEVITDALYRITGLVMDAQPWPTGHGRAPNPTLMSWLRLFEEMARSLEESRWGFRVDDNSSAPSLHQAARILQAHWFPGGTVHPDLLDHLKDADFNSHPADIGVALALESLIEATQPRQPASNTEGADLMKEEQSKPKGFAFEMGDEVKLTVSGEAGVVKGRAEFLHAENSYLLVLLAADGRQVEGWWGESVIEVTSK